MATIDVLIPTFNRPLPLAVTVTSLLYQTYTDFRLCISDQSEEPQDEGSLATALRLMEAKGRPVDLYRHLPRRGLAEQRQFLLDKSQAPYVLYLDDDVLLEPNVLEKLYLTLRREGCGFVGNGLIGLSFLGDNRPDEQAIEFWYERVTPERVVPESREWLRHKLHNAANLYHVARKFKLPPEAAVPYKIAWIGGCVLYDVEKLRASGGFSFWKKVPPNHVGEDVLAQLQVMERFGGCGVLPSGAYHQELPTTVPDRTMDLPYHFYNRKRERRLHEHLK